MIITLFTSKDAKPIYTEDVGELFQRPEVVTYEGRGFTFHSQVGLVWQFMEGPLLNLPLTDQKPYRDAPIEQGKLFREEKGDRQKYEEG